MTFYFLSLSLILSMYKFYHTYSVFFFRVCTRRAKKKIKSTAILLLRLRKLTIFLFLFLLVYDILRSSVKEGNLYCGGELAIRFYEICCFGEWLSFLAPGSATLASFPFGIVGILVVDVQIVGAR